MNAATTTVTTRGGLVSWPTVVFALAVTGIVAADLMTLATWRAGYPEPYEYWREASLAPLAYGVVGWTIATRLPENRLGLLLLSETVVSAIQDLAGNFAIIGAHNAWPHAAVASLAGTFLAAQTISLGILIAALLTVPTGRPLSRFFHWCLVVLTIGVSLAALAQLAIGTTSESLKGVPDGASLLPSSARGAVESIAALGGLTCLVVALVAIVGLALRWRRSGDEERRQVTWVVMGALAGPVLIMALAVIPSSWPWWTHDGSAVWAVAGTMLPLGIAVAVLRHGLYELDSVVSRTVSYAIVTGGVLLVYVLVVAAISQLAPSDNVAVAAATLTAAATARPLLRRVRDRVDKQFNRARFDHALAAADFSAHMQSTVDPGRVQVLLVDALHRTLQPRATSVWVRSEW